MPLKSPLGEYLSSNPVLDPRVVSLLLKYGARVIFKSQFRDPLGILNCLNVLSLEENSDLFSTVLGAAEDFDPPIIRRCPSLSEEQKGRILTLSRTPLSLKHQVRLSIRALLGDKLARIGDDELGLPKLLGKYLKFEIS